ncbi:COQ9 family protein [Paracoccaceae bacterium]|nr:COQ9 family protein [Paracoccaceae bacterium]
MKNSYKADLVTKMLSYVPDLGWTWDALYKAGLNSKKTKSLGDEELYSLFDNKISNIIGIFNDKLDEEMCVTFNAENNKNLGVTQTVKALVLYRLRASENYKSIIKTSLFFMAQPGNAYEAFKQLMKTSNKIWDIAGDTSTGRNFYTKRLILAGVYSSTLAYWLAKETRSIDGTEPFLDKRLDDVKNIGKISKQSIEVIERTKQELRSIIRKKI